MNYQIYVNHATEYSDGVSVEKHTTYTAGKETFGERNVNILYTFTCSICDSDIQKTINFSKSFDSEVLEAKNKIIMII